MRGVYSKLFKEYLLATNVVSSGCLFATGDALQQNIEKFTKTSTVWKYDWKRTGRLFLIGLSQGPPHHFFYIWLDKILPKKNFSSVCKKIFLDQIIAAPFFAVTFFIGAGLLEGKSLQTAYSEFSKKFLAVYMFDWVLWPPTQAINFYFVPMKFRVLYVNGITVIWDTFLSYMKHYDETETKS